MTTLEPEEAEVSEQQPEQQAPPQRNPHAAALEINEVIEMYETKLGSLQGALLRTNMQQEKDYALWDEKEKAYKDAIEMMAARIAELEGNHPGEQGTAPSSSEGSTPTPLSAVADLPTVAKPVTKPQARKKARQ